MPTKTKKPSNSKPTKVSNKAQSHKTSKKTTVNALPSSSNKLSILSKVLRFIKKHKIISALVIVLLIWLAYTQTMNYLEKRKFLSQYSQLEDYANQISKTHPPTNKTSEKSCRYQSAKLGHGDLYCWVSVTLEYENYSADKANQTTEEMKDIFSDSKLNIYGTDKKTSFSENDDIYMSQSIIADNSCYVSYKYSSLEYVPRDNKSQEMKNIYYVFLSCNRFARSEHFPLKKP